MVTSSNVEAAEEVQEVEEEVEQLKEEIEGLDLGVRGRGEEERREGEGEGEMGELGVLSFWNMISERAVVVIFCIREDNVGWDHKRRMYLL